MFKPSIKKRVMSVFNDRIEEAQKYHDESLEVMKKKHEDEENALTDSVVDGLLSVFVKN